MPEELSVVYSSALTVSKLHLATLAVFYDRIWLPYPYDLDTGQSPSLHADITGDPKSPYYHRPYAYGRFAYWEAQSRYQAWKERNQLLFQEGILSVLPCPVEASKVSSAQTKRAVRPRGAYAELDRGYGPPSAGYLSSFGGVYIGSRALALHDQFADLPAPELFIGENISTSTPSLVSHLVRSLFSYQVPHLQELNPEQVLEVRDYVSSIKESFRDYLSGFVDELESRARRGDQLQSASLALVERKILPPYHQFRRQLESKRTGFWGKLLTAGGKFLQIDAALWTPKFYGALIELASTTMANAAEKIEKTGTNEEQAFHYLARLEEAERCE